MPCAWPVTPDMVNPGHPSIAVDQVNHVGEAVARRRGPQPHGGRGRARAGRHRLRRCCPWCSTWRQAVDEGADLVHDHLASNTSYDFVFDAGEAGTGADTEQAFAAGRRRGQPPVRPAAADPGLHGAALGGRPALGRQLHDVVGHPGPAHPAGHGRDGHRHPGAQAAGHRPRRRRRLRRQAAGHPGGDPLAADRPAAGQAGQVDRDPQRVADERPPRPRPGPVRRHRRRPRGQREGPEGAAARRHGRLPAADHAGRPGAGRVHVPRHLQVPGLPVRVPRRLHEQDAHRRLPRRRAAGGHVRHRADHGRARRRAGHGPAGAAPQELDQRRRVPLHHGRPASSTTAATTTPATQQALELLGYDELRAEQQRRRESERPGPAGHRLLHLHRDVRAGPLAGARLAVLRRGRLGVGVDPDAAHRQGRGGHRLHAARPGARDGLEPARRRPARRPVRGRRGAARRHRDRPPRHGHLRVPVARRRRHRGGEGRRQGGREGPQGRRAPAGGQRGRPGLQRAASSASAARPGPSSASRRSPWRSSPRTTTPRTSSPRSTPRRRSTRTTSPSPTARTSAPWRSTPRPAW